jgi:molybdenum-dependent DNA-binding transcriptional regulator ModE
MGWFKVRVMVRATVMVAGGALGARGGIALLLQISEMSSISTYIY